MRAQQTSAGWTRVLGLVAIGALIVSGFGVYYLRRTLKTNEAVVKLMQSQSEILKQQSDISTAQIRANLKITKIHLNLTSKRLETSVSIENKGKSPADDIYCFIGVLKIYEADYENEKTLFDQTLFRNSIADAYAPKIYQDEEEELIPTLHWPKSDEADAFANLFNNVEYIKFKLRLTLTYVDAFKQRHEEKWKAQLEMRKTDLNILGEHDKSFDNPNLWPG